MPSITAIAINIRSGKLTTKKLHCAIFLILLLDGSVMVSQGLVRNRWFVLAICLSLLWPISYAILSSTNPCSALIPHTHLLLNHAHSNALERHLSAERNCHSRPPISSYGYHFSDYWSPEREVISVLHPNDGNVTSLLSLVDGILISNILPTATLVIGLSWLMLTTPVLLTSFASSPPHPPPRAV